MRTSWYSKKAVADRKFITLEIGGLLIVGVTNKINRELRPTYRGLQQIVDRCPALLRWHAVPKR